MTEEELKIQKENRKQMVIEYLRKLPVYKWAAASAFINEDTLINWRKEDQSFADRCEAAKSEAISKFAGRATPDFILKNVDPQTFKDKKETDITSGGKPIMGGTAYVPTDDGV